MINCPRCGREIPAGANGFVCGCYIAESPVPPSAQDYMKAELAAAQKRIAELEEHYRCMVSLVQSPSGFTCTEPGAYALNVKVFEDGSGLVKCIEKMRPDQDCYPSLEWQEFHHVVKRLEKAEAERDALKAQLEATCKERLQVEEGQK